MRGEDDQDDHGGRYGVQDATWTWTRANRHRVKTRKAVSELIYEGRGEREIHVVAN